MPQCQSNKPKVLKSVIILALNSAIDLIRNTKNEKKKEECFKLLFANAFILCKEGHNR